MSRDFYGKIFKENFACCQYFKCHFKTLKVNDICAKNDSILFDEKLTILALINNYFLKVNIANVGKIMLQYPKIK